MDIEIMTSSTTQIIKLQYSLKKKKEYLSILDYFIIMQGKLKIRIHFKTYII